MKIHRIETVNLNSLYGKQEVDLDATLQGASLFLIHGPTGSGKSTLMDAVSLALFGVTPRLDHRRGSESRDPRAIMSRGTHQCLAEIVFSKIEAGVRQRYRARWTARRAWKRADGARQASVRSLECRKLDGTWKLLVSSAKRKDYAPVFERVLEGFGVRDFNRSMLLAQGQFDAFLGAPPDERAEILERLTDTSIYQRLGARAARIRGRHARRLEALRTLAAAGGGLDAEALQKLEEEHKEHTGELGRRKRAYEQAAANREWFDADVELRGKLHEVEVELQELVEDRRGARDALARLTDHERCEQRKAFRILDAHRAARAAVVRLEGQITRLDESIPGLEETARTRERRAATAAASEGLAVSHLEALGPLARAADETASAHEAASERADRTAAEGKRVEELVGTSKTALDQASDALAQGIGRADAARADLEAHAADGELASRWDPIRTRLDKLVSTSERLLRDDSALQKREAALEGERSALDEDRAAHEAVRRTALALTEQASKDAKEVLLGLQSKPDFDLSRGEAADAVERAGARQNAIRAAATPVAVARKDVAELEAVRMQIVSLSGELGEAQDALDVQVRAVEHKQELQSQAQAALARTRRVASLVEHRVALVDGESCPLCGSEEHPWSHDPDREASDAEISETVAAAERAHDDARDVRSEADRTHRVAEGKAAKLLVKLELLTEQERKAVEQQADSERAATSALQAAGLPTHSTVDAVDEALRDATAKVDAAIEALRALDQARGTVYETERKLKEASEGRAKVEVALRDRGAALQERSDQIETDRDDHAVAVEALREARTACSAMVEELGLPAEGADPAAWRDRGDARVHAHRERVRTAADLQATATNLEVKRQGVEALLAGHRLRRGELAAELKLQVIDRDHKRDLVERAGDALAEAWRAALLADDTRPTDVQSPESDPSALLAAQKGWVKRTVADAREAAAEHREVRTALDAARIRRQTLAGQLVDFETTLADARTRLDRVLEELEVPGDDELRAVQLDDEVLVELRGTRKALEGRTVEVETRIRERRHAVVMHASTRPRALVDDPQNDVLLAELAKGEALLDGAAKAHQETAAQLRAHALAVQEQQGNQKKLREAQQEARVWQTLHDYIGVNDGGKFKQFAQALNLGQLLDKANVHIARLSERYRLIPRIEDGLPTLEFDLADLWQVGERVAPCSLSGGERFLVSLSLALGLSDFRAVKMPIETLLLDEGFGTLDPGTLSVALGALSQLQADGRQVGIISHVVGLQERIDARIEVRPLGGGRSRIPSTG